MKQNKEIPKGYKDSPLGIIPEEWEVKRFGEIFSFKNGINASKENYGKGVKFVNTMDVLANDSLCADLLRGSVCVTEKQEREFAVYDGDILFNRTSETREEVGCSSVYLDDNEAVFGGFIIRARCLDNTLFDYYKKYCFKTNYIRNQITSFGNGAIRYNLGQEDLSKVTIILPPLSEQQKIAEILSTWDKATEKQTALIEKLELRKRGLMQQLLTGKKRLKGFNEEWKTIKFGDVMEKMSNGLSYDTTLISGIPVTRIETISKGIIDYKKIGYAEEIENIENYRLRVGDILFSHINSLAHIGKVAIYRGEYPLFHGMNLLLMRASTLIYNDFLYYFLCSESSKKKMKSLAKQAVNQASINTEELKCWVIRLPSLCEQVDITNILMTSDREIELARTKLITLRSQKSGLMQQLLTGKKRINYI